MPQELVLDIVSAGRAIGQPHARHHRRSKWHSRHSHNEDELESEEDSEEPASTEAGQSNGLNEHSHDELEDAEDEDDDFGNEEIMDDDSEPRSDHFSQDSPTGRKRSLQLEKRQTMASKAPPSTSRNILSESATYGTRMSLKFINMLIWLPTDLTLGLSKGFHNVPKFYHDPMVKPTPKVKNIRSGFRAAGKVCSILAVSELLDIDF